MIFWDKILVKMNTMTRSLLSEYYGFGSEGHLEKSFSAHGGLQTLEILPEEVEVSITKQLDDESDDDAATEINQKENENLASYKLDAKKPNVEQRERPSRFLSEEISSTIEDGDNARYEIFLQTNAAMNDYVFEDEKSTIKCDESSINTEKTQLLKPAEEISDENLVPFELETLDAVRSNISSPMPKKRSNRKLKTSAMPLPPPPKKIPVYNEVFLDLTSTGISEFPLNMLDNLSKLKMIYLENNNLTELPHQLFTVLKSLNWLDARNNRLTSLPSTIARHPCLETLLLQGNRIEKLPLELCLVPRLKGLQTMRNPLTFPPKDVVSQGCEAILNYLRKEWRKLNPEEVNNDNGDVDENGEKDRHNKVEVKPDLTTILCYKPNNTSVLKKKKLKTKTTMTRDKLPEISSFTSTSSSAENNDERTVRQKSWDYRPNNRYETGCEMIKGSKQVVIDKPGDRFAVTFLKRSDAVASLLSKKCSRRCSDSRVKNNAPDMRRELTLRRGESLSSQHEIGENNSSSNGENSSTKKPVKKFCLPRMNFQDFGYIRTSIDKPFKKSRTKERVFQIITHDRVMMKFYPMQLDSTYWILEFLETYLDMKKKV